MTQSNSDAAKALWSSSGYSSLTVADDNTLQVTDEFLRAFFQRPELVPIDSSCAQEQALHQTLLEQPERKVSEAEIAALADPDARENYQFALAFRDLLLKHSSLESTYFALISGEEKLSLPPMLVNLLVELIVQHLLLNEDDVYQYRAGELFFRQQKVSLENGVLVADAEYLQRHRPSSTNVLESLIKQAGGIIADGGEATLDVLNKYSLSQYRERPEAYALALSLNPGEPGIDALCRVLEYWIAHFHDAKVTIKPLREIQDEQWRWHIGLDVDSNRILNKLYQGETLTDEENRQLLALFRLEFADPSLVKPELAGFPIYLAIAMNENAELRLKPQNLLLNLPLATPT